MEHFKGESCSPPIRSEAADSKWKCPECHVTWILRDSVWGTAEHWRQKKQDEKRLGSSPPHLASILPGVDESGE